MFADFGECYTLFLPWHVHMMLSRRVMKHKHSDVRLWQGNEKCWKNALFSVYHSELKCPGLSRKQTRGWSVGALKFCPRLRAWRVHEFSPTEVFGNTSQRFKAVQELLQNSFTNENGRHLVCISGTPRGDPSDLRAGKKMSCSKEEFPLNISFLQFWGSREPTESSWLVKATNNFFPS